MSKISKINDKQIRNSRNSAYSISDSFLTGLMPVLVGLAIVTSLWPIFQYLEKYSLTTMLVFLEEVFPKVLSWGFLGNLTLWVAFILWCGTYLVWNRTTGNNLQIRTNLSKLSYAKKLAYLGVNLGALLGLIFMAYFIFELAGFILAFIWFNVMHWACLHYMQDRTERVRLASDDADLLSDSFDFWYRYTCVYLILNLKFLIITVFFPFQELLKAIWGLLLIARVVLEFRRNEAFYTEKPVREGTGNVLIFTR